MGTNNTLNNCWLCSVVSKANGEDPIGTAGTYDHWLIFLPECQLARLHHYHYENRRI
jgi:hypothetical protein